MTNIVTWPGAGEGALDWRRLGRDSQTLEKPLDLLAQHEIHHSAARRSYGAYLAVALLLLVVIAVYALAQLLVALGGVGGALTG